MLLIFISVVYFQRFPSYLDYCQPYLCSVSATIFNRQRQYTVGFFRVSVVNHNYLYKYLVYSKTGVDVVLGGG